MKNTLLILSGGMDSTVALYEYMDEIGLAVTFNYGSKHNDEEIKRAILSCAKLGINHRVVNLEKAFRYFESDLLKTGGDIPEGHYADENMKHTVVPFRNGIMLSIATGLAESHGLSKVMLASHAGDHTVYPDCRPEFNKAMGEAMEAGTSNQVKLSAPFKYRTKEELAYIGEECDIEWADTYSCYKGGKVHCGRCSTCVERIWALRHVKDNTQYLDTEYAETLLRKRGEW